ncbi:hypothetical protein Taro_023320 [Colocasia esculenta]|uniref:Uncharacterized protein n=1 Tax=Colocasia esculenta TaxID=4460 RepID=A0A843V4E0_COLES|nr:hypothetical protein [Colocasia esculenta]
MRSGPSGIVSKEEEGRSKQMVVEHCSTELQTPPLVTVGRHPTPPSLAAVSMTSIGETIASTPGMAESVAIEVESDPPTASPASPPICSIVLHLRGQRNKDKLM